VEGGRVGLARRVGASPRHTAAVPAAPCHGPAAGSRPEACAAVGPSCPGSAAFTSPAYYSGSARALRCWLALIIYTTTSHTLV
jgi:hypothetical protein